jgi:hypothetical protein
MVPNTSVAFEADDPLNEQPKARGDDALDTLIEMRPATAAPTVTFAVTAILPRAEHSADTTPSDTPFEGIVIVPVITWTPLLMFSAGLQLSDS